MKTEFLDVCTTHVYMWSHVWNRTVHTCKNVFIIHNIHVHVSILYTCIYNMYLLCGTLSCMSSEDTDLQ